MLFEENRVLIECLYTEGLFEAAACITNGWNGDGEAD